MLTIYNLDNPYDLHFVGFTDITNFDWNSDIYTQINKLKSKQLIVYYDDVYIMHTDKFMGIKNKKIRSVVHYNRFKEIIIIKKHIYKSGNVKNAGANIISYLADKIINIHFDKSEIEFEYIKGRNI